MHLSKFDNLLIDFLKERIMSTANTKCDVKTAYGSCISEGFDNIGYQPSLATIIVSEVVSELIDNVVDIAINKGERTSPRSYNDPILMQEGNLRHKFDSLDLNFPLAEEQQLPSQVKHIIQGLNTFPVPKNTPEEPVKLDIEMKRLLSEMMSPPYQIINYETVPRKDGVGDQPLEATMEGERHFLENRSEDRLAEPETIRTVEKKSRVTDLVMNSKQVLNELLMDENARKKIDEWEEQNEEVLDVINLDYVKPGEVSFDNIKEKNQKNKKKKDALRPEQVPLPDDGSTEDERDVSKQLFPDEDDEEVKLLPVPNDKFMDNIDLSRNAFQEEERLLECPREGGNHGGKGDEFDNNAGGGQVLVQAEMTPIKSSEDIKTTDSGSSKKDSKKKKWNFGTRIWGFIKNKSKHKEESSSSGTIAEN